MTAESKATKKIDIKKIADRFEIKLLFVIAAAFFAGLAFRRSAGIVAMTPVALLLCGGAAFIDLKSKLKILIFTVTVFAMNTVEQNDIMITLMFTALCLLACVVFEIAAILIRNGKKYGIAVSAVGTVLFVALSFIFVGNPFAAIKANNTLQDYIETYYPENESAALGEFEFTSIYYNFETGAYSIDAVSSKYPTETATLTAGESLVKDNFRTVMEDKLTEPYVLEITELLRKYFPYDSFTVIYDDIATFPNEPILSSSPGELYGDITFEITIGGIQSATAMLSKTKTYLQVIDDSGIEYARLIFKSGTGQWYRRSITVEGSRNGHFETLKLERVHAGTSNFFNRYVSKFTNID